MSKFKLTEPYFDEYNNKIIFNKDTLIHNVDVTLKAKNSTVIISPEVDVLRNIKLKITGENGICIIGKIPKKNNQFRGEIRLGYDCFISIGDNITCTRALLLTTAERTQLLVGDDCMFATGNQMRTDDVHAIYDVYSGERLNKSKDITIGAHTWVSYNAKIFGGSSIGSGSIVGLNSIVKGKFPNNCTIAGSPAKIVRSDVAWERPNIQRRKPWIRDEAPQSEISERYWNATDRENLIPYLGEGFIKNLRLLNKYKPDSKWLLKYQHLLSD